MLRGSQPDTVFYGVNIGQVNNYPLTASTVYYWPDDDMLYLYPVEGYGEKRSGEARRVYEWYRFPDILSWDSEVMAERIKVSTS